MRGWGYISASTRVTVARGRRCTTWWAASIILFTGPVPIPIISSWTSRQGWRRHVSRFFTRPLFLPLFFFLPALDVPLFPLLLPFGLLLCHFSLILKSGPLLFFTFGNTSHFDFFLLLPVKSLAFLVVRTSAECMSHFGQLYFLRSGHTMGIRRFETARGRSHSGKVGKKLLAKIVDLFFNNFFINASDALALSRR